MHKGRNVSSVTFSQLRREETNRLFVHLNSNMERIVRMEASSTTGLITLKIGTVTFKLLNK